jgi:hypothetical protein
MAAIIISDLHFPVSESFLIEMNDMDFLSVYGGDYILDHAFHQMIYFAHQLLHFMMSVFAMYSIASIAQSFMGANVYSSPSHVIPF